jgi:hypothetical protein
MTPPQRHPPCRPILASGITEAAACRYSVVGPPRRRVRQRAAHQPHLVRLLKVTVVSTRHGYCCLARKSTACRRHASTAQQYLVGGSTACHVSIVHSSMLLPHSPAPDAKTQSQASIVLSSNTCALYVAAPGASSALRHLYTRSPLAAGWLPHGCSRTSTSGGTHSCRPTTLSSVLGRLPSRRRYLSMMGSRWVYIPMSNIF